MSPISQKTRPVGWALPTKYLLKGRLTKHWQAESLLESSRWHPGVPGPEAEQWQAAAFLGKDAPVREVPSHRA